MRVLKRDAQHGPAVALLEHQARRRAALKHADRGHPAAAGRLDGGQVLRLGHDDAHVLVHRAHPLHLHHTALHGRDEGHNAPVPALEPIEHHVALAVLRLQIVQLKVRPPVARAVVVEPVDGDDVVLRAAAAAARAAGGADGHICFALKSRHK